MRAPQFSCMKRAYPRFQQLTVAVFNLRSLWSRHIRSKCQGWKKRNKDDFHRCDRDFLELTNCFGVREYVIIEKSYLVSHEHLCDKIAEGGKEAYVWTMENPEKIIRENYFIDKTALQNSKIYFLMLLHKTTPKVRVHYTFHTHELLYSKIPLI